MARKVAAVFSSQLTITSYISSAYSPKAPEFNIPTTALYSSVVIANND
jgi:hypothetical protein